MVGTQRYKRGFVKKQSNKITDSGESYYISISIENIQRRATKFILNHPDRKTSYTARLKTLSLLPLEFRREVHDLVILYKIRSGLINASFDHLLLPANHTYATRRHHPANIRPLFTHTQRYFTNSFFPRTIKLWNDLPSNIKQASSLHNFKALVKRFYTEKLTLYTPP